jgi:hypothetical protein
MGPNRIDACPMRKERAVILPILAGMIINDSMTSREHARVECRRGKFMLTDMSTNGTYVVTPEGPFYLRR